MNRLHTQVAREYKYMQPWRFIKLAIKPNYSGNGEEILVNGFEEK